MKALVLSGGKGTRLRPLTYTGAKQLVPVANRPILSYVIDNIVGVGIKEIGIIISPETGEEIKSAMGDGSAWGAGVSITYILQEEPRGLAHAVMVATGFLGDEAFVMYLGDNLLGCGIEQFVETFNSTQSDAVILLKPVDNPCNFGIAEVDAEGRIIGLQEKPLKPKSNLALVGVYIFSAQIHKEIARLKPSARGEYEITDAIAQLVEGGKKVHSHMVESWWLDTGKKDDLLEANTTVLDEWTKLEIMGEVDGDSVITSRVSVSKGATIKNSTLRGPIVVGEGVEITDSFIGPYTSIGAGTVINKSVVEHSVILANSEIDGVDRMEDSLVGKGARVKKCHRKHKALRLMIGDDSVVEV